MILLCDYPSLFFFFFFNKEREREFYLKIKKLFVLFLHIKIKKQKKAFRSFFYTFAIRLLYFNTACTAIRVLYEYIVNLCQQVEISRAWKCMRTRKSLLILDQDFEGRRRVTVWLVIHEQVIALSQALKITMVDYGTIVIDNKGDAINHCDLK